MKKKFIFRSQKCWYEINTEDKDAKIIYFTFAPTADTNFIDSDGDEFFLVIIIDRSCHQQMWAERNYEYEVVEDCASNFDDCLTNDEFDYIEEFINSLLEEAEA